MKIMIRALRLKKRELQQLPVKHDTSPALRNAARHLGWFYGDRALGREYSSSPYVICEAIDGGAYLTRVEFHKMRGTDIVAANIVIPQVIVG